MHVSRSLATYAGASKAELLGAPWETLAARCSGELAKWLRDAAEGVRLHKLVRDGAGRLFEARSSLEAGICDVLLDEVSPSPPADGLPHEFFGVALESLTEDELRTFRQPERRVVTLLAARLDGLSSMAAKMQPLELRVMLEAFYDEAAEAILETGCTVVPGREGVLMGLFGAPRLFADHGVRALKAACEILARVAALHASFAAQGREMAACSIGLWTGEATVGAWGLRPQYSAIGAAEDMAQRLARLCRPGEILLPEPTFQHILENLPAGWTILQAESEGDPDCSDFQWRGEDVRTLPDYLQRNVCLVGPGAHEDPSRGELFFEYLWAWKIRGKAEPMPILRAARPDHAGDTLELKPDHVLSKPPEQVLGKYRLVELLGSGGMGKVWRGLDRFGNTVAIKVLHAQDAASEAALRRFRREAEVMAKLAHRNICRVYEVSEFEGIPYIAMEYVEGLSLADILYSSAESTAEGAPDLPALIRSLRAAKSTQTTTQAASGLQENAPPSRPTEPAHAAVAPEAPPPASSQAPRPQETRILPVQQILAIMLKVCEAVQFAHEHGVLHRDLKPANILLREDGEPLVADFGLAKLQNADPAYSVAAAGHVVGTLENMPPEQAQASHAVDERADVYALGTILYQALTGRRHFAASGNLVADAQALQTHEPVPPRVYNARLDPDLEVIVLKALRNNPAERYPSAEALRADLERFQRGEPISARPLTALGLLRKLVLRNRAASMILAGSLLLLAAVVSLSLWGLSQQLAREQAARREAEQARAEAEWHKSLAEERRREAEAKEEAANAQRLRAEALLREKEAAEAAAASERARTERALAETREERRRRLEAELRALEKEAELESARQKMAAQQAQEPAAAKETASDSPSSWDASSYHAAAHARRLFVFDLTAPPPPGRHPQWKSQLLAEALDLASQALAANPSLAEAWRLKARLHATAKEYAEASQAFAKAADALANQGKSSLAERERGLAEAARQAASLQNSAPLVQLLHPPHDDLDTAAALLLRQENEFRVARSRGRAETALALFLANSLADVPAVEATPEGAWTVRLAGSAADLSPLRGQPVRTLEVRGARQLDWAALSALPLERLVLREAALAVPARLRGFSSLRELHLENSASQQLDFVRGLPQLERLHLAQTPSGDLSPLGWCRRLRALDLSGADRSGLRALGAVPLESLTVSPELISDGASLRALRGHRTLRILRAPSDPPHQTAAEFWRKFDAEISSPPPTASATSAQRH